MRTSLNNTLCINDTLETKIAKHLISCGYTYQFSDLHEIATEFLMGWSCDSVELLTCKYDMTVLEACYMLKELKQFNHWRS